jgi:hypothetical protein
MIFRKLDWQSNANLPVGKGSHNTIFHGDVRQQ